MSREHRSQSPQSAGSDDQAAGPGRDMRQLAMMKRAQERKSAAAGNAEIAEARSMLRNKVTHELKETMYEALDVFQAMVRADERADAEVDASFVKNVGDKATDFLTDHALDIAKESFEMGESVIGDAISPVFGFTKDKLSATSALSAKLTASEAVDSVVKECREATDQACEKAGAVVDAISDEKMAEIAGVLDQFNGVESDSDNQEEGSLKHGLQEWMMEKMGAPKTGGAAVNDHAMKLYEVFRAEVRKTETAGEQIDEISEAKAHPGETEDKAEAAEETIGVDKEVSRDETERKRVDGEAGE